ncbi:MAG TPA: hypothetical protein VKT81_27970 [Bryobacteraceae bacterium]|nr:hypothetical protein [Bryobacteraceae bacterium]
MKSPLFLIYGIMLIGGATYAHIQGWAPTRINQQRVSPKSIRDNPGAYRSMYGGGYSRYIGGK